MEIFSTQQFQNAFQHQPDIGDWVLSEFYTWKRYGKSLIFGRDAPDSRPKYDNLMHVHVIPSDDACRHRWDRARHDYDRTSDRFLLYAQYEKAPAFLLIDFYHDPGAHQRLHRYYGDVQDSFTWAKKLPPGATRIEFEVEE